MTRRSEIQQRRLEGLESEFRLLLPLVLKECAAGRWGLFGQNDQFEESRYLRWPQAEHLKEMAYEIRSIRQDVGDADSLVERLLHDCSLRGANVPGEPKLAKALLDEIDRDLSVT